MCQSQGFLVVVFVTIPEQMQVSQSCGTSVHPASATREDFGRSFQTQHFDLLDKHQQTHTVCVQFVAQCVAS